MTSVLIDNGFNRSKNDYCLFTRTDTDVTTHVLVCVVDIVIGSRNQQYVYVLLNNLCERFKMDDRGPLPWILGMSKISGAGLESINQTHYIDECVNRLGHEGYKPVSTPADAAVMLAVMQQ